MRALGRVAVVAGWVVWLVGVARGGTPTIFDVALATVALGLFILATD